MASMLRIVSNTLKRHPIILPCIQSGGLMGSGDVVSQLVIERKRGRDFDPLRTLRFFGIGAFYIGPILTKWFQVLDRKLGSKGGSTAIKKMVLDQFCWAPVFICSILGMIGLSQGKSVSNIKQDLEKDYVDILLSNWTIWPAVQLVNFYAVPLHHQVLVVQIVALFWNTYISWKTNRNTSQ